VNLSDDTIHIYIVFAALVVLVLIIVLRSLD
jgi:hypothetical protein